jgi:hypothetical protein
MLSGVETSRSNYFQVEQAKMNRQKLKIISIFVFGMLTFAVGFFFVRTFVFVRHPEPVDMIEDWKEICFWPDKKGIEVAISPKGCYSTTCTRPQYQAGTAIVDVQRQRIRLETRFVLVKTSRFPLPCIENCAGGGTVQLLLGPLMPNIYEVWFRDEKVGQLNIYSGRVTPRQCIKRQAGDM